MRFDKNLHRGIVKKRDKILTERNSVDLTSLKCREANLCVLLVANFGAAQIILPRVSNKLAFLSFSIKITGHLLRFAGIGL